MAPNLGSPNTSVAPNASVILELGSGAVDVFGDPSCGAIDAFGDPSCGATDLFGDPRFGATDTFSDPTITSFLDVFAFLKLYL